MVELVENGFGILFYENGSNMGTEDKRKRNGMRNSLKWYDKF
jgi:hypothetical protein